MKRITSIDTVRGIVMVIMALDHVRDLIHFSALNFDPTDLTATTPYIFFTRWITHLCAPTFVFLSGVSAYLSYSNANDKKEARQFMWKRGLWLILLEITIVNFGIWFDLDFGIIMLQVISAIGCGFLLLTLFLQLKPMQNFMLATLIFLVCNLFVGLNFAEYPTFNFLYHLFVSPFLFQVTKSFILTINYPVLPWFGIMLAGFACGSLFSQPTEQRAKLFIRTGGVLLVLFIAIRMINLWGDPLAWSIQKNWLFTFMSFMNISKYPPSLLYTLATLSIAFTLLYLSEKFNSQWNEFFMVFGSVPMFYYLIHFYLIHLAAQLILLGQGFSWSDFQFEPFRFGRPTAPSGISLFYVYIFWLSVIAFLYPICKKYSIYKKAHPEKSWLKYL